MQVYPKLIVLCPKVNQEQYGHKCKSCEFYNKLKVHGEYPFIDCKFDK